MKARRLSPAQRVARRLLAMSRTVRDRSIRAFHRGWLGAAATGRLLAFADAITIQAARLAVRGYIKRPAEPTRRIPSAVLMMMRTLPVGVLAATSWPGLGSLVILFAVACAAVSAMVRKQSPTAEHLTDWDVTVAVCSGAVLLGRLPW